MGLSIRDRADLIATFRYVSVYLMETLARWVPTTPELEVKVVFGRHIWEFAQHADALGKRTAELRAPLHNNRRPVDAYAALLEELDASSATAERVRGLYEAAIPDLERRYTAYLEATNPLLDEPSVRVIDRILRELPRLRSEAAGVLQARPDVKLADAAWPGRMASRFQAVKRIVEPRAVAEAV
ncbi:MAG: hypothetical protein AB7Q69_17560 [Gemmatimonadales bacterium]